MLYIHASALSHITIWIGVRSEKRCHSRQYRLPPGESCCPRGLVKSRMRDLLLREFVDNVQGDNTGYDIRNKTIGRALATELEIKQELAMSIWGI